VYNSDLGARAPIIEATLTTDPAQPVPTQIQAQLTFHGSTGPWRTFGTSGHQAGDTYLLAVAAHFSVNQTDAYAWQLTVRTTFPGGATVDRTASGTAVVVVHTHQLSSVNAHAMGNGWSLSGLDRLVSVSGGKIYVTGSGGGRLFTASGSTFVSPANDFGTLTQLSASEFLYTAKDQGKVYFDSEYMSKRVDRHNQAVTYQYSSNRLSQVLAPDGGIATLIYQPGPVSTARLQALEQPGGRRVTLTYDGSRLIQITDPDGSNRDFSYSGDFGVHDLESDAWQPLRTTYTRLDDNVLQLDRGEG
jgi:YD repeat-containing protein